MFDLWSTVLLRLMSSHEAGLCSLPRKPTIKIARRSRHAPENTSFRTLRTSLRLTCDCYHRISRTGGERCYSQHPEWYAIYNYFGNYNSGSRWRRDQGRLVLLLVRREPKSRLYVLRRIVLPLDRP